MPEEGITFGAPILETLTTGMYREPLTVFREYVQNSCDSIDAAINAGIIHDGEGKIDIAIDSEARRITITDNDTGIKASDFRRVMGNIADSDKRQAESRGFRGIGRLCGMAYCRTLTFTAKFKGEGVISRLVCDGGVLRELLHESDSGINRYTASEVLGMINEFSAENVDDIDAHYFRVELDGINDENTSLLDFDGVRDYLSFVAPLPYSNNFIVFRSEIHRHAEGLGFKIDEYDIFLNGEQLFKPYTLKYPTSLGGDEIFDVAFRDFIDDDGNIIAWMWFGLSCFRGR